SGGHHCGISGHNGHAEAERLGRGGAWACCENPDGLTFRWDKRPPNNRMKRTAPASWSAAAYASVRQTKQGDDVAEGVKHFGVVGVVFALALGWLASSLSVTLVVAILQGLGQERPTDSYAVALLLTPLSITMIIGLAVVGNRVLRMKVHSTALSASSLAVST